MFYAMWLVCVMGVSQECQEIERKDRQMFKTEQACMDDALMETKNLMNYLIANGLVGQVGYKCVEDKNSI